MLHPEIRHTQVSEEEQIARKVEVGNTRMTKTPDVIISTPVYYKEWGNGNFVHHLKAHLLQRLNTENSIELNYIVNLDRNENRNLAYEESETEKIRRVLRSAVYIQQAQRDKQQIEVKGGLQSPDEKRSIIRANARSQSVLLAEEDPEIADIFKLAQLKAGQIDISFVDISRLSKYEIEALGYHDGNSLTGSLRTFGSDYARKRTGQSPDSIFQLSDIDTVPSSNKTYDRLIKYYKENPGMSHYFANISYLIAGDNDLLFSRSPYHVMHHMRSYLLSYDHQSPMITMRANLLNNDDLDSVRSICTNQDTPLGIETPWEDSSTSRRIMATSIQNKQSNFPHDTYITMDRKDGYCDSSIDRGYFDKNEMLKFIIFRSKFLKIFDSLSEEAKDNFDSEFQTLRIKYTKEIKKQRRMNVGGLKAFLKYVEKGHIKFDNGTLSFNQNEINNSSLKSYLKKHKDFVAQLTDEDLVWLEYLTGKRTDSPLKELNERQIAMRNFFGTFISYQEIENLWVSNINKGIENDNVANPSGSNDLDRASRFYGTVVEHLVLGEIYRKYMAQRIFWSSLKKTDPNASPESISEKLKKNTKMLPYEQRSVWLNR